MDAAHSRVCAALGSRVEVVGRATSRFVRGGDQCTWRSATGQWPQRTDTPLPFSTNAENRRHLRVVSSVVSHGVNICEQTDEAVVRVVRFWSCVLRLSRGFLDVALSLLLP